MVERLIVTKEKKGNSEAGRERLKHEGLGRAISKVCVIWI